MIINFKKLYRVNTMPKIFDSFLKFFGIYLMIAGGKSYADAQGSLSIESKNNDSLTIKNMSALSMPQSYSSIMWQMDAMTYDADELLEFKKHSDIDAIINSSIEDTARNFVEKEQQGNFKYLQDEINEKLEFETPAAVAKHYNVRRLEDIKIWKIETNYFKPTNFNSVRLKPAVSAAELMDSNFEANMYLECQSAATLMIYKILHTSLQSHYGEQQGNKIFDNFFGRAELTSEAQRLLIGERGPLAGSQFFYDGPYLLHQPNPVSYFLKVSQHAINHMNGKATLGPESNRNLKLGSYVYFESVPYYKAKHPSGYGMGWNVVYIGKNEINEDLFWGMGLGIKTEREIKKMLADDYNAPPSKLDKYLIDEYGIPPPSIQKIKGKDITLRENSIIEFDENKYKELIADHQKVYEKYQKYLQEQAYTIQKNRDDAFKEQKLRRSVYKTLQGDLSSNPMSISEKNMKLLANKLGMRVLKGRAGSNNLDIVDSNYKVFLHLSDLGDKGFRNMETEYPIGEVKSSISNLQDLELGLKNRILAAINNANIFEVKTVNEKGRAFHR